MGRIGRMRHPGVHWHFRQIVTDKGDLECLRGCVLARRRLMKPAYPSSSYSHCGQGVLRLFIHLLKTLNAPGGRSMLTAKGNGQWRQQKTWRLESDQSHLAKGDTQSEPVEDCYIYWSREIANVFTFCGFQQNLSRTAGIPCLQLTHSPRCFSSYSKACSC
jgi:hypothetical protein